MEKGYRWVSNQRRKWLRGGWIGGDQTVVGDRYVKDYSRGNPSYEEDVYVKEGSGRDLINIEGVYLTDRI